MKKIRPPILFAIISLSINSCFSEKTTEPDIIGNEHYKFIMTKIAGDYQTGNPSDTLIQPIVVLLEGIKGNAVPRYRVIFKVFRGSATLTETIVLTDKTGRASSNVILGQQEETITVEAKAFASESRVYFFVSANQSFFEPDNMDSVTVESIAWKDLSFPGEKYITNVAFGGGEDIYVGTVRGLYKSTDFGESWTMLGFGVTSHIWALAVNSLEHVFVGTFSGLFRSTDHGNTFYQVDPDSQGSTTYYAIAINSKDEIFCMTSNDIIRVSPDLTNWSIVGPHKSLLEKIIINSRDYILVASDGRPYLSVDNGEHFEKLNLERTVSFAFNSKNHILALKREKNFRNLFSTLHLSTDNGDTWNMIGKSNMQYRSIVVDSHDNIYVSGEQNIVTELMIYTQPKGVIRSKDNGKTWKLLGLNDSIVNMEISPGGYLFAWPSRGLFRSETPIMQ